MAAFIEQGQSRKPGIGLTPLIDIVFILLVFFMLVVQFQRMQQRELNALPTAADAVPAEDIPPQLVLLPTAGNTLRCLWQQQPVDCRHALAQLAGDGESHNAVLLSFADNSQLQDILALRRLLEDGGLQPQLILDAPDLPLQLAGGSDD